LASYFGEGFRGTARPVGGAQAAERGVRFDNAGLFAQVLEIHDPNAEFRVALFQRPA